MHCDFEPDRSVPDDNKGSNSISWDNKNQTYFFFYYITVSNSVDFDQTACIQEHSDLCLHPFLRPINPFGIFFDL